MKMVCMECSEIVRVGRASQWRAARPRCMKCGSMRLENYVPLPKRPRPDKKMGESHNPSQN